MGKETEPQPNPLEHASDAVRSGTNPQELLLFNAMSLGLLMATRQEIAKIQEALPRKVVEEVFVPVEEEVKPNKWYQAQLDKQNK